MGKYLIIPSESQQYNRESEGTLEPIIEDKEDRVGSFATRDYEGGGCHYVDKSQIYAGGNSFRSDERHARRFVILFIVLVGLGTAIAVPMHPSLGNPKMRHGNHPPSIHETREESFRRQDIFDEEDDSNLDEEIPPHSTASTNSMDNQELENIRRSIMEGLGLSRIPDPSKANVSQTEYENAHREYLNRLESSGDREERTRRRLHVFHPAEYTSNGTRRGHSSGGRRAGSLFFNVDIPDQSQALSYATLRLLLGGNPEDSHEDVEGAGEEDLDEDDRPEVVLYQPTRRSRRLIARQRLGPTWSLAPRWMEFDSTEAVESWLYDHEENLGLEVEVLRRGRVEASKTIVEPALNVFTVAHPDLPRSRTRRATPDQLVSLHRGRRTECRGQNKKCCRHQMTVTFKDLKGFEFIIQPKTFDAGYCKGRCPPRYNPAHHHALLQSLIWKEDRKKAPRPCCAPSKLAELEILYFDENDPSKLKVSNWNNMQVLECACS